MGDRKGSTRDRPRENEGGLTGKWQGLGKYIVLMGDRKGSTRDRPRENEDYQEDFQMEFLKYLLSDIWRNFMEDARIEFRKYAAPPFWARSTDLKGKILKPNLLPHGNMKPSYSLTGRTEHRPCLSLPTEA
ncbi:hypothetical protein HPP92_004905 [Vanilla planifolia]|uniref:Uncharacterized protein n=1 Tax=Vanilla planifolia TaxID=51239 RepID=A0A835RKQ0_VANPL|nr:hypothetical protein HPP92_005250 [Vanilla planifolia]KAG0493911.1 hypothetical protein HPP92_004905 [Vanilla planifolia]